MEIKMNEEIAFYLAQGISVLCGILAIIMMQLKNMKTILFFQIIVNLTASLNYILLGGDSGAFISLLAIIQSIVMFLYNTKNIKPQIWVLLVFAAGYISISAYNIVSSGEIIGILPAIAAICFCICLVQEKPSVFRIWGALNPSFWLVYDIMTRSYVMFFVHLGILISTLVAMIRLDGFLGIIKKNND